jgi:ornithine decarboxylase
MAKFVLYKSRIVEQYEKIKEISDIVSYSYKTNPFIGQIMEYLLKDEIEKGNLWFSVNTKYTIFKKNLKPKILFFMQGESKEEVEKILNKTNLFVVDNINDLNTLLSVIKEKNQKIILFLRMKIREHTVNTGKYFVYGFSKEKVKELLKNLSKEKLITLGLHFHRKTQNIGEWFLKEDFEEIFSEEEINLIKYVNIGGGFPYYYVNSKPNLDYIFEKVKEFKDYLNKRNIKLITEPGRFIAAPCVELEAEVINVYDGTVILDCSLFNAYIDTYLFHIRLPIKDELNQEEVKNLLKKGKNVFRYLIKGNTPDSLDIFRYKVYLPYELKKGDKIILKNAGAYNFYCEFNDLPKLEYEIR